MKNGLNKFAKGMFVIFTIKLLLFGVVFVMQSCQTDNEIFENSEQRIALKKFESLAKHTAVKFENMALKQNNTLNAKGSSSEDEEKAKEVLRPLIQGSKELFSAYGINESDFEELESEDPRIAILGLALLSAKTNNNNRVAINLAGLFATSVYAQNAYDCALRAVGIDAVVELFNGKVTKKIAKKAIKKIASRALGWIGAAWAAYEFGDCMGWYK